MSVQKILISLIIISFIISSCDKIEAPYIREHHNGNDTTTPGIRKVLLEDYTGHKCINCPTAAFLAHDLEDFYNGKLIIMSVHAGFFALPGSGDYTADFRTPAGDELDSYFEVSAHGNPKGMVNRTAYNQILLLEPGNWGQAVAQLINLPSETEIDISLAYHSATRKLDGTVSVEFTAEPDGNFYLCIYVVEDHIIAPQKNNDNSLGPTPDWLDYEHHNVLRGAVNGTWGEALNDSPILVNDSFQKNFTGFQIKNEWNDNNCSILAFVYHQDTKSILQVELRPIKDLITNK